MLFKLEINKKNCFFVSNKKKIESTYNFNFIEILFSRDYLFLIFVIAVIVINLNKLKKSIRVVKHIFINRPELISIFLASILYSLSF